MKVLFLILNYKTYTETIRLTSELIAEGLKDKFVLIVDNASPNESYQELSTQFKGLNTVEVIQSPENGGYAKGNNFGLIYAKKYNPEYVCIINNDVHFSIDMIDRLCEWYEKLPNVIFIAPRQILPSGTDVRFGDMDVPTLWKDIKSYCPLYSKIYRYTENTEIRGAHQIGLIPGAFIFTKYNAFLELGFFDECTFLFCEERFIAKKAELERKKSYIILTESYIHDHSVTISSEASAKRQRQMIFEGRCKYYRQFSNYPIASIGLLKSAFYANELYRKLINVVITIKSNHSI